MSINKVKEKDWEKSGGRSLAQCHPGAETKAGEIVVNRDMVRFLLLSLCSGSLWRSEGEGEEWIWKGPSQVGR